jgi:hypothetical protein
MITGPALQALFTHLDLSPGFWPALKLFGSKVNNLHESVGGFHERSSCPRSYPDNAENDLFEFSYIAKHVEQHGRPNSYDPWSVRQIGVSHQYNSSRNQSTFIIINPSAMLVDRIDALMKPEELIVSKEMANRKDTSMLDVHRLILCTVTEQWSQYVTYLESMYKDIVSAYFPFHILPCEYFIVYIKTYQAHI